MTQRDQRTYSIIGAAMEVHRELGSGFLEAVYHEALTIEMTTRNIEFAHEVELPIIYKGQQLATSYRADFICFDKVILEIKALGEFSTLHEAQILNYLKATGLGVGLLINFEAESLQYKRYVNTKWK